MEETNVKEIENWNNNSNNTENDDWWYWKINSNYKKIYTVIFKYWMLILVLIAAIIIFFLEIRKNMTLDTSIEKDDPQRNLILKNAEEKINNDNDIEELETIIKWWLLKNDNDLFQSYSNLIKFKWFTMPKAVFIYDLDSIKPIEYFDDQNYEIQELENLIKNIIYINYKEINTKEKEDINLLKLENDNIEETFFVSCANWIRIFDSVCNHYIDNFLNSFFIYDIEKDINWTVQTLKNLIKMDKYKEKACIAFNNYITYSNSASNELSDIARLCWWKYLDEYKLMQSYNLAEKVIWNWFMNLNVDWNIDINNYQLLSYQQIIYNDLEQWIINAWRFNIYSNFLSELLQWNDNISNIYLDSTYRFNNVYIIPKLNKLKYQSVWKKEEIESIIAKIDKINNWNSIEKYEWLKNRLTNIALQEEVKRQAALINSSETDSNIQNLLKSIKSLSYLKVINNDIIDDSIKINWYLSIGSKWDNQAIPFGSLLKNGKWWVKVEEIAIIWYDDLNETLWYIIKQREYSLAEIYEYIQKNINLYASSWFDITTCDLIKNRIETLWIQSEILHCSPDKINILKSWENSSIYYQISMNNYNIENIAITDKKLQAEISKMISWVQTNSTNIPTFIENIITFVPEWPSEQLSWKNSTIIAISDFRKFLWVVPSDIAESNWKIAAEFKLNEIDFIWIYNSDTKKLWPLYFKWSSENKNENVFKNFSLTLKEEYQNDINRFILETIDYLKELNPGLVNKFIDENFTIKK